MNKSLCLFDDNECRFIVSSAVIALREEMYLLDCRMDEYIRYSYAMRIAAN